MRVALAWIDMEDPTDRAVALGLGRALRRRGHAVWLVGPRRRPGEKAAERIGTFPVRRFGGSAAALELARFSREASIDVWHFHIFARDHAALARAAAAGKWPRVVTPHLVLEDYLPFAGGEAGFRRLAEGASGLTVVSRASREELVSRFPEWKGRVSVVYNGADAAEARTSPVGRAAPFVLNVGRIAPYKGQDVLMMAFAKALERRPGLRLVVCGRDQTRGGLAALVRSLGLGGRVRLSGGRAPSHVRRLLRRAQFLVLASRRENFPLVLLENMRAGKAVVATKVGGVPELVRHGVEGLLVPPGDVGAMAAAVESLSRDGALRARLGAAALERSRRFTWDRAAEAYVRLYAQARVRRLSSGGILLKKKASQAPPARPARRDASRPGIPVGPRSA
ncbi:MAG: glycosyltransferase family 4 protein [Elusimicrobia bacterium]|nr:glycosyltransferase family 4 protein [Elusimicrobiota bacterium]